MFSIGSFLTIWLFWLLTVPSEGGECAFNVCVYVYVMEVQLIDKMKLQYFYERPLLACPVCYSFLPKCVFLLWKIMVKLLRGPRNNCPQNWHKTFNFFSLISGLYWHQVRTKVDVWLQLNLWFNWDIHLAKDGLTLSMGKGNNEKKIQICWEFTVLYLGPL